MCPDRASPQQLPQQLIKTQWITSMLMFSFAALVLVFGKVKAKDIFAQDSFTSSINIRILS